MGAKSTIVTIGVIVSFTMASYVYAGVPILGDIVDILNDINELQEENRVANAKYNQVPLTVINDKYSYRVDEYVTPECVGFQTVILFDDGVNQAITYVPSTCEQSDRFIDWIDITVYSTSTGN